MKPIEPLAIRILKRLVVACSIFLIIVALLFNDSLKFKIGDLRIDAFTLMALAIPMIALLLLYEITRSIHHTITARRHARARDQALIQRINQRRRP